MFSILVVEDDSTLNKLICAKLKQEGFKTHTAGHGEEALRILGEEHIDLIITDVMMPGLDGYELTRELREASYTVPVLMVTAKNMMDDIEKGFLSGTDDYMVKPVNLKELVLRVKSLLRRSKAAAEKKLVVGNTVLNYDALTVTCDEKEIELAPKEFYLIFKMLSYPNHVFTRLELMDEIWGMDSEADDRTVDSHIKKLRKKFDSCNDFEIITIRGLGYKAKV